jgi:glyoxylase-like metal-dependent hydrolase (beta-lactamase superfamily II)
MIYRSLVGLLTLCAPLSVSGAEPEVKVTELRDGIYMIENKGGVIGLSIGEDGALLVDSQYATNYEAIRDAIRALEPNPVRYLVNTHFHLDHTGGNEGFGKAGAVILAQTETRRLLESPQYMQSFDLNQDAFEAPAIPQITFPDRIVFHLNGETVEVYHPGPAHTGGDAIVFFHEANVVHAGDVLVRYRYPFIDTTHGGSLPGTIAACEDLLTRVNDETMIITGHGGLSNKAELVEFIEMLKIFESRITPLAEQGLSLEEIEEANPLRGYESTMLPASEFIRLAVEEIRRDG